MYVESKSEKLGSSKQCYKIAKIMYYCDFTRKTNTYTVITMVWLL